MSENPYANYPAERAQHGEDLADGPSRMSVLALAALVLSIPACCIPLLGIGAGPLAAVLGVMALLFIGRSKGRLGGRGLAATAIFLGVIATVLHGAVGYGCYTVYVGYRDTIVVPTGKIIAAMEKGDVATVRTYLSPDASTELTDDDLRAFAAVVHDSYGAYKRTPMDLETWWSSFKEAYSGSRKPKGGNAGGQSPPIPVALEFEKRLTVGFTMPEQNRLGRGAFALEDLIVVLPDGRGLTLRKDGPAHSAAKALSKAPVTAAEMKGEAAPAPAPAPEKP